MSDHKKINRRTFLGQASCAAVGMTTFMSTIFNLKAIEAATYHNMPYLFGPFDDYKALVCILLGGGMDSYNLLVPKDNAGYNEYATTRSNLAIPKNNLLTINPNNTGGQPFGLHPSMTFLSTQFSAGNVAFISNVGTLLAPTTKAQVQNGSAQLPLGLYSHSDQVAHWQTGIPQDRVATGWGGKMADLLNSLPIPPMQNPNISMNISLSGSNIFQTGNNSVEFSLSPENGSQGFNGYDHNGWLMQQIRAEVVDGMIEAQYQDLFRQTYAKTIKSGRDGHDAYEIALQNTPPLQTDFLDCNDGDAGWGCIEKAVQRIAETINIRQALGVKRQIFFVEFGGWDHHDELLNNEASMLGRLDSALSTFYDALVEMNVLDKVTTFTISEFSRTLLSNGNGTDHAWGANVFAMGGAVNGNSIYGQYPDLALDSNQEIGNGILLPTTSTDEYFAELALWFGVPASDLLMLYPNLGNFYNTSSGQNPIGFLT